MSVRKRTFVPVLVVWTTGAASRRPYDGDTQPWIGDVVPLTVRIAPPASWRTITFPRARRVQTAVVDAAGDDPELRCQRWTKVRDRLDTARSSTRKYLPPVDHTTVRSSRVPAYVKVRVR